MSRIGKKPVDVPAGVDVAVDGSTVRVKGPKGSLERSFHALVEMSVDKDARQVVVGVKGEGREVRALHGLWRSLVKNMVEGVTNGYEKIIEIIGVGYKAEMQGKTLKLMVGYANPVEFPVPAGLVVEVRRPTRPGVDGEVVIRGIDKELLGQFSADVRQSREPDLYHGKGVRYRGEYIRKLAGKTFGSS